MEPAKAQKDDFQNWLAVLKKLDHVRKDGKGMEKKNKGIQTQIGTYASHVQPVYKSNNRCPNSLDIFNRTIALPMFYSLKEEDIDMIAVELEHSLREL